MVERATGSPPRRPAPSRADRSRALVRRRAVYRRRRLMVAASAAGVVAAVLAVTLGSGAPGRARPQHAPPAESAPAKPVRYVRVVRAALLAHRLPSPRSREVVVPSTSGSLWVLGGLDAAGGTVAASYRLDPRTGAVQPTAPLGEATHDAAGTLLGADALVVGGGTAAPASEVQIGAPGGAPGVVGALGAARSDARAVTIGHTAYVVGGYDGLSMDSEVLATTNGRSWRVVADLPVPVRYPTLAVVGRSVYVLGGQSGAGTPVPTVQRVEPAAHRAVVVGSMGVPLEASVAARLDGTVYLAGGLVATAGGTTATGAVYAFSPGHLRLEKVASLPVPVANAGGAVLGGRLYVVGGEGASGAPVADVQAVSVAHRPVPGGAAG